MANGYSQIPTGRNTNTGQAPNRDTIINYGDVTFVDDEIIPEDEVLDEEPSGEEYSDEPSIFGDIIFNKTIFSKKSFDINVNNSFSELNQSTPIDLSAFFRMYENLFFDLPKEGVQSHSSIIQQSTDYVRDYIDPKDEVIRDLEEQIRQLEYDLADNDEEQEHPVFRNGTMIINVNADSGGWYYMDKGYARNIKWNTEMVDSIKMSLYGETSGQQIPRVTQTMLDNIPKGYPGLSEDNFGLEFNPRLNEANEKIGYLRWYYDENGTPPLNPKDYDSAEAFIEALNEDLLQKKEVRAGLGSFINGLRAQINQLKTLDPAYYEENYGSSTGNGNGGNGGNGGPSETTDAFPNQPPTNY